MAEAGRLLVNIDVPDVAAGEAFYSAALGLAPGRRFGAAAVELLGLEAPLYLLLREDGASAGTAGANSAIYDRHWTPVHLDVAVDDLDAAVARAQAAGAHVERPARDAGFGRIATLADPFGHGFCFIQFSPEGYDAIAA
jgi:predicted enzyme related to lactoylglutathione lyase